MPAPARNAWTPAAPRCCPASSRAISICSQAARSSTACRSPGRRASIASPRRSASAPSRSRRASCWSSSRRPTRCSARPSRSRGSCSTASCPIARWRCLPATTTRCGQTPRRSWRRTFCRGGRRRRAAKSSWAATGWRMASCASSRASRRCLRWRPPAAGRCSAWSAASRRRRRRRRSAPSTGRHGARARRLRLARHHQLP